MTYKDFILNLTNEARQRPLKDWESGILRAEGQCGELEAEIREFKMAELKTEILALLKMILEESPENSVLVTVGSCFAEGDISHIGDEELRDNLRVLLEVDRERKRRVA